MTLTWSAALSVLYCVTFFWQTSKFCISAMLIWWRRWRKEDTATANEDTRARSRLPWQRVVLRHSWVVGLISCTCMLGSDVSARVWTTVDLVPVEPQFSRLGLRLGYVDSTINNNNSNNNSNRSIARFNKKPQKYKINDSSYGFIYYTWFHQCMLWRCSSRPVVHAVSCSAWEGGD